MSELMIFKAGKYPQGDWPKERVKKLVDAYDPEKFYDAPLVIGHRWYGADDNYQDAHGWVQSLRMDGSGKVFATVTDVSADLKKKVAEKKLKYMSVEIYENDKVDEKQPPYLRAIALLGRDTPAVAGAKLPAYFSLPSGGTVCFAKDEEHTTVFTSRVGAAEIKSFSGEPENKSNEPEVNMEELEKLKADLAERQAELAAFKKENADLKNAERKNEAAAFFGKLRDEGKLTPALFEKAVSLDARLGDEERKELRAMFGGLEAKVDLSGTHAAPKGGAAEGGNVSAKIRAYQKEKGLATFAEAAEALYANNPGLFEDEGGEA
ncbi:MAG: hypothetical protein LBO04_00325 [Spirochaetaceae bacterium]|jgi:hypothetical protein|nr:hypothetical protein [Spirochaetaceae bacterium]